MTKCYGVAAVMVVMPCVAHHLGLRMSYLSSYCLCRLPHDSPYVRLGLPRQLVRPWLMLCVCFYYGAAVRVARFRRVFFFFFAMHTIAISIVAIEITRRFFCFFIFPGSSGCKN